MRRGSSRSRESIPLDCSTSEAIRSTELSNSDNRDALKREKAIYERLGNYRGIIHCFKASDDGIELAFAKQGDLKWYIKKNIEPHQSLKTEWILSLIDTLSYIHSRRVFVDEIALRNILVSDEKLTVADFGQSMLLSMGADVDTICEQDLTAKIEILHLGWVIYSIAVWRVHDYYFFNPSKQPSQDLSSLEGLFCGTIIQKCWSEQYVSMGALDKDARDLLTK
ncbi:hypothetical protein SBOR_9146 [Sclerotinia borealis F-4128]|uniref:Protein kinase domain-containing protein n=1 Tax=Sclerotinia borealis (strain F-4128) TaxID=1432307 RepID=W9C6E3_SCLBF|nr:hypothetical protein SBOR_9146 [Sclerotinia borealis F-4128]